jgi:hypothetical protein
MDKPSTIQSKRSERWAGHIVIVGRCTVIMSWNAIADNDSRMASFQDDPAVEEAKHAMIWGFGYTRRFLILHLC